MGLSSVSPSKLGGRLMGNTGSSKNKGTGKPCGGG